jgi:uncharacterized protein (DUF1697 family)
MTLTDDNMDPKHLGLLQSSRDAFQQAAAFNGGKPFWIRGLDSENATTMINGVTMNKLLMVDQWKNWRTVMRLAIKNFQWVPHPLIIP